jgi:hypothetical protein
MMLCRDACQDCFKLQGWGRGRKICSSGYPIESDQAEKTGI